MALVTLKTLDGKVVTRKVPGPVFQPIQAFDAGVNSEMGLREQYLLERVDIIVPKSVMLLPTEMFL